MKTGKTGGPLAGTRIVEIAALGPVPYCAMLLSDLGAEVVRVDRVEAVDRGLLNTDPRFELLNRGRRSVAVDLKQARGVETVLRLAERADALLEGFRPGVAERLGIGPDTCLARNPRLVYGRMTGWGQDGPLAASAGHDVNYISLAGALHAIGNWGGAPVIPLNLVGDFGGGALFLALGVVSALLEASRSGRGQVVDAAIVDGAASLMTMIHGMLAAGDWAPQRGANLLDGGMPFYAVYETSDRKHVSLGAIEPKFWSAFVQRSGLDDSGLSQTDPAAWPELRRRLAALFRSRTREEWCALLEGTDACVAPVLSMTEAPLHPHLAARGTFTTVEGVLQAAPTPRFSRTPGRIQRPPEAAGASTAEVLKDWGIEEMETGEG
jgi:alpha-methylacyl-CoA racemase